MPSDGVRVTLYPLQEVLLPTGRPIGELRAGLAQLLQRPELVAARFRVAGVDLEDAAVVGETPLLPGATLRLAHPEARRPHLDAAQSAAPGGSPWVIVVESGPEAGRLLHLSALAKGRRHALRHGSLRVWHTRRSKVKFAPVTQAGFLGQATTARLRRATTWPEGGAIVAPPNARYRMFAVSANAPESLAPMLREFNGLPARAQSEPPAATKPGAGLAGSLLPALGSIGLAIALRQPAFALFSLVGLVPMLTSLRANRRAVDSERGPQPGVGLLRILVASASAASDACWFTAVNQVRAELIEARMSGAPDPSVVPEPGGAICGPLTQVRAAARARVLDELARGSQIEVLGSGRELWAFARWAPAPMGERRLVVVDEPDPAQWEEAQTQASHARRLGARVLFVVTDRQALPAWCTEVVRVSNDGEPLCGLAAGVAETMSREVAALAAIGRRLNLGNGSGLNDTADPTQDRMPDLVPLCDLLREVSLSPETAWWTPLGRDASGAVVGFDLLRDGPHLLVAGTTGSGKSELLQTLILGLATRRTPQDLSLALVDFKGGASFGPCVHLPHVVGQVSDLDLSLAARALAGLRAELVRRKRVLAGHGVADLAQLPKGVLPRLVVVFDEFRALVEELPDAMNGLLRVAAQGRSLGVHLVLATQRPAGAVTADLRANVSARLALRVVDQADSIDVLDSPLAARIPVGAPGRAVLRVGAAPPRALQCAYPAAPPASSAVVRPAPAWLPEPPKVASAIRRRRRTLKDRNPATDLAAIAAAAAETAGARPAQPAPWLPPLPTELDARLLGTSEHLPFALADQPDRQSQETLAWDPALGRLAILGSARTGKTTVLHTLALAALARGYHVHVVLGVPGGLGSASGKLFAALRGHPGFGTLATMTDSRLARELIRRLTASVGHPQVPTLVLIDELAEVRQGLADATDPVAELLSHPTLVAATTSGPAIAGLAARFAQRLVLTSADAAQDAMLGAPRPWAGLGAAPGRGVWLAAEPVECQVAQTSQLPAASSGASQEPRGSALRLMPLPPRITLDQLQAEACGLGLVPANAGADLRVLVGVGGDAAAPIALPVSNGALIVGPRGSGRTNVLRVVLAQGATQVPVMVLARPGPLREAALAVGAQVFDPDSAGVAATLAALASLGAPPSRRPLLLVDDAEVLDQFCPQEFADLGEVAATGRARVVAATTTLAANLAHRGLIAQLRANRIGVVLRGAERGSSEVFATDVPADLPTPGRGALVWDGQSVACQIAGA